MTFEQSFPSLWSKVTDNYPTVIESNKVHFVFTQDEIKDSCIDKEKVKAAIDKLRKYVEFDIEDYYPECPICKNVYKYGALYQHLRKHEEFDYLTLFDTPKKILEYFEKVLIEGKHDKRKAIHTA